MADARSKLDILYQDVLGEIHEVISRVDGLKADLPTLSDALTKKLEIQTGSLLMASEKLKGLIDTYADAVIKKAAESAKLEMRTAATDAVRDCIVSESRTLVAHLNTASANLEKAAERTRASINDASKQLAWGWGKIALVIVIASVGSTLLTLAITSFWIRL